MRFMWLLPFVYLYFVFERNEEWRGSERETKQEKTACVVPDTIASTEHTNQQGRCEYVSQRRRALNPYQHYWLLAVPLLLMAFCDAFEQLLKKKPFELNSHITNIRDNLIFVCAFVRSFVYLLAPLSSFNRNFYWPLSYENE